MKIAINVIAIIGAFFSLIGMIILFILGNVVDVKQMVNDGMNVQYYGKVLTPADTEEIEVVQRAVTVLGIVGGVLCFLPLGINITTLIITFKNPQTSAPYIVVGVLGLFLGAAIVGILLIIYGVTKEYDKNKPSDYIYNN